MFFFGINIFSSLRVRVALIVFSWVHESSSLCLSIERREISISTRKEKKNCHFCRENELIFSSSSLPKHSSVNICISFIISIFFQLLAFITCGNFWQFQASLHVNRLLLISLSSNVTTYKSISCHLVQFDSPYSVSVILSLLRNDWFDRNNNRNSLHTTVNLIQHFSPFTCQRCFTFVSKKVFEFTRQNILIIEVIKVIHLINYLTQIQSTMERIVFICKSLHQRINWLTRYNCISWGYFRCSLSVFTFIAKYHFSIQLEQNFIVKSINSVFRTRGSFKLCETFSSLISFFFSLFVARFHFILVINLMDVWLWHSQMNTWQSERH